jgi:hypothetical protein
MSDSHAFVSRKITLASSDGGSDRKKKQHKTKTTVTGWEWGVMWERKTTYEK